MEEESSRVSETNPRSFSCLSSGKGWLAFFMGAALQSLAALAWLLSIPGDPKNSLLFGFSASRLAMMAAVLAAGCCFLAAGIISLRSPKLLFFLQNLASARRNLFTAVCLALGVTLTAAWGALVSLRADPGEATYFIYTRLLPPLALVCLICLESILWLLITRQGFHPRALRDYRRPAQYTFQGITVCAVFGLVIVLTGFGITPDEFFWGSPGVPLLSWQVVSSALLALAGFLLFQNIKKPAGWKTDLLVFLLFWIGAYILWMSQPIPRSYFTPTPRPPNFEIYPYSDAGFYDFVSQSLLTGNGFLGRQIITRPIYAVMLAGFHALVGQDYKAVIAVQTILLALFPALLYLLGKNLHSREAGIMAAAFATWREINLLTATPLTEVSHSKMLMTDSLTGVAFAVLILFLVWWQRRRPYSLSTALAIGGCFGLMLLLRTQAVLVLPVILLIVLVNHAGGWRRALVSAALFAAGAAISFSPWLIRNYQLTGQVIMDQPSQTAIHAMRFSLSMDSVDETLTSKPPAEVSAAVIRFVLDHPVFTLKFMAAHFLNNEFSSLTLLPTRLHLIDARDNLFIQTPFWLSGLKGLTPWQVLLLSFNLSLVVVGAAYAFWKMRWTGLMPLLIHLAYSASSAATRISGWRFVQPVDWVIYLYYAVGIAWVFAAALRFLGWMSRARFDPDREETSRFSFKPKWVKLAGIALVLFLIGSITPAVEAAVPKRYPVDDKDRLFEMLLAVPQVKNDAELTDRLAAFQANPDSIAIWGRALYPRFYKEETGEPGSGWMAYKASKYSKLGFVMITPSGDSQAVLPQESPPAFFPNASDVLLAGCKKEGWIEAVVVIVGADKNALYLSTLPSAFQCQ